MNLDKLDENRIEEALIKLTMSDKTHADWYGEMKFLEESIKQAESHAFLLAEGTVAERTAIAKSSETYAKAVKAWAEGLKNYKLIDNQRNHEIRIIDIWRTLSSNRRQGTI